MTAKPTLFEVTEVLDVSEVYHYIEWVIKDPTGKKLATVYKGRDGNIRCLTCDRKMVGGGYSCIHAQAARRSLDDSPVATG